MTIARPFRARLLGSWIVAAGLALPGAAAAQATEWYTLEEVLVRLEEGARRVDFAAAEPDESRRLGAIAARLRESGAASLSTREVAGVIANRRAGFLDVARWDAEHLELLAQPWLRETALDLAQVANASLEPVLSARLTEPEVVFVLEPINQLQESVLRLAQSDNLEKLRRYRIKYGPDSARLNAAEVALNYAAQWVPGFGPSEDGWPSPLELVAAYHVTDLAPTWEDDDFDLNVVSGGEVGVRHYDFGDRPAEEGRIARLLRPRQRSAGLLLMGPRDEPLHRVWGEDLRTGLFIGWGSLHLGYLWNSPRRLIIGNSTQIIPYLF